MTVEELLSLVNKEVDTTKFKALSQKTINEELNDVLDEFGDDEAANAKIVTKVANRLKRMDGNLHKNVSDEIKKSREEAERKKKEEEERKKKEEEKDCENPKETADFTTKNEKFRSEKSTFKRKLFPVSNKSGYFFSFFETLKEV